MTVFGRFSILLSWPAVLLHIPIGSRAYARQSFLTSWRADCSVLLRQWGSQGIPWFQSHGQWGGRDYANIAPGDAIFFDWDLDGSADHVGLVVGTDGSRVYTVEGNSGDACKIKSYSLSYECIKGYGLMNW